MINRTIWIINQYASTPETGIGGRHFYLAREMVKQGYTIYLIAASYTHLLRNPPAISKQFAIEMIDGTHFVWVKMPVYEKAHSKNRVLNWLRFAWKLLKLPKVIGDKPDAILYSSPSLIPFLSAQRLSKKFQCRLIFEVRDIWPLTLVELGGYSQQHPFIRLMQWIEDRAYRDSNKVVSNLPNAVEHMISRGMDRTKFSWVPNGFSLDEMLEKQPLATEMLAELPTGKFLVGYTGTLGVANALDSLIEAAELLSNYENIAFVIVGGGQEKHKLKQSVLEKGLRNVVLIDPIPKIQIQSMLHKFDICFISLTRDPLFKFGISPNKLFEYFYSAKPIIYAIDSGDYLPVNDACSGISIPAENPQAIAEAILKLQSMTPEQRTTLGTNGKRYAELNHDYAKLAEKLAKAMFEKNHETSC